jgi:hypothetical protein
LTPEVTGQPDIAASPPYLVPTGQYKNQSAVALDKPCLVIGSRAGCDLQLADSDLKPVHAAVLTAADGVYIRNLAGPGGLLINGHPVDEQLICPGDEVQVGQLSFKIAAGDGSVHLPETPPRWDFQIDGAPLPPPRGHTAVIGSAPFCDIRLGTQDVSDVHALIFSVGGQWHLRDLATPAGTFVNGRPVVGADVGPSDVVRIGPHQLNRAIRRPSGPLQGPVTMLGSTTLLETGDAHFGGMPVALPEVSLPKGFGQVSISFGDHTLRSHSAPPRPQQPPPPPPEKVDRGEEKVEQTQPVPESPPEPAPLPQAEAPQCMIPAVPKLRTVARGAASGGEFGSSEGEDPMPAEESAPVMNDAPFGGVSLGGADGAFDPDLAKNADILDEEFHFSENEFWDQPDEHAAEPALPERAQDLCPSIPPAGAPQKAGNGDVAPSAAPPAFPAAFTGATALAAPPKISPAASSPTISSIPWRPIAAAAALIVTAAAVWLGIPAHSTIQGRLVFLHTAPAGTPAWREFEADQRHRLADPSLIAAAVANLHADHPGVSPGFLKADSKPLASIIQAARFEDGALLLTFHGTDPSGDMHRLTAVLKALYRSDADLISAVADAKRALDEWEPRITSRQTEARDLERRIAQQRKVVDAANGRADQLPALQAAAFDAGRKYLAAEEACQADQFQLDRLAAAPTTAPSTQPATSDRQLAELGRQVDELTDEIAALQSTTGDIAIAAGRKAVADARKQQDAAMAAAAAVLRSHSDVNAAVLAAVDLQNHVNDLITQLFAVRHSLEQVQDLQRLMEQTTRRYQRMVEDADPQLRRLFDQLDAAQRQVAAEAAAAAATKPATTAPSVAAVSSAARRVDDLLSQITLRQRKLSVDDGARLRSHVDRLIDDFTAQMRQQRQLVIDTLGTLLAGLQAAPVPPDLSLDEKNILSRLMQSVENLAQAQSDYAAAATQSDAAGQTLASDQQQVAELKQLADSRRRILAATTLPTTAPAVSADEAAARLSEVQDAWARDRRTMEAARREFTDKSMASVTAGLTVTAAAKAQQTLLALTEARDARLGDLRAMQRSGEDLAQRLNTAVDLKEPTEANVTLISDNQKMKTMILLLALAAVGGILVWEKRVSARGGGILNFGR